MAAGCGYGSGGADWAILNTGRRKRRRPGRVRGRTPGLPDACARVRRVRLAFMPAMHGVVQRGVRGMGTIEQSYRLYTCARCAAQVRICRHCDRGNRYCAQGCAAIRRRESLARAGRRYQASYRGACAHAARTHAWRVRHTQEVTHQGSASAVIPGTVAACSIPSLPEQTHADCPLPPQGAAVPTMEHPAPCANAWASGAELRWPAQRAHLAALHCSLCGRVLPGFARFGPLRGGP